jgi:MFS family permease
MIIFESLIIGMGFGTTMPSIMVKISTVAPRTTTTLAIAFATSAMGVGQFISPLVLNFIGNLIGNGSFRFIFLISGIGILGCAAIWVVLNQKIEKILNNATS